MAQFYLAAAHKSSGKTTVAIGLCAALKSRGHSVQAFKKGPDYIDPMWLERATGRVCWNLDFHTASREFNQSRFQRHAADADISVVEGNMGLFDGLSLDGSDSNAAMAKLLGLPVVLVLDCAGTSGGVAPLLTGYRQFDPGIQYAGVILNKLAGQRHESKIRALVERYTDFNIVGAIHRGADIRMTERHLGLVPSNEISAQAGQIIDHLSKVVAQSVDLDYLSGLEVSPMEGTSVVPEVTTNKSNQRLRVAIARDDAFGFYYPDDLARFAQLGVELVEFDASSTTSLPQAVDGLFVGGGFPESRLAELSANFSLRDDIRQKVVAGLPTYAECGGLMYLCRSMSMNDREYPLCGVIPARVRFSPRPQGRGYAILRSNPGHPWYPDDDATTRQINAHEFHYSWLDEIDQDQRFGYTVERGTGIDGINDGIIISNMVASYVHQRQTDQCTWVDDFVGFIKRNKSKRQP